jgi:hypothetical protein
MRLLQLGHRVAIVAPLGSYLGELWVILAVIVLWLEWRASRWPTSPPAAAPAAENLSH